MLILAALLTVGARTPSLWISAIDVSPRLQATLTQHAIGGTDGSAKLGPSDPNGKSPTVIAWPIALKPRHVYAISFSATNIGRQAIDLSTDFQGTNYDSPEQEFSSALPADGKARVFRAQLDTGDSPPNVQLRFFYMDTTSVEVSDITILERPGYWKWLGRLGWLLGAMALGWLVVLVTNGWLAPHLVALSGQPHGMDRLSLAVGLVSSTGLLLFMSWLGQPQVFADEFSYAYLSTHFGHEANIANSGWIIPSLPNRLFLGLYHALSIGAAEPYAAARAFNIIFVLAAFAALLDCGRRAGGGVWSWFAALAGVVGPSTTYAAYFMPETLFIALMYWVIVLAAEATSTRRVGLAAGAGALAACLILVKPHGIVPTAVIGVVMAFSAFRTPHNERRRAWFAAGSFLLAAYAVRALLVRLLAPEGAIDTTLTGAFYSDVPGQALAIVRDPARLVNVLTMLGAHILVTMLLATPAILTAIHLVLGYLRSAAREEPIQQVRYATTVLIMASMVCVALIAMTAVFTVAATGSGVFEVANRLHMRYYAFCLPLIVVAFAGIAHLRPQRPSVQYLNYGLWLVIAMLSVVVLPEYVWHIADAPDLFLGELVRHWVMPLLVLIMATTLFVVNQIWFKTRVANVFVLSYIAIGVVTATAVHVAQLQDGPQDADRIGRVAATIARGSNVPMLVVADGYSPDVFRMGSYALDRTQFSLNSGARIVEKLATLSPRTVIVGPSEILRLASLPPTIQFGPYGIAWSSGAGFSPANDNAPVLDRKSTRLNSSH
jgi:hypothetical protein